MSKVSALVSGRCFQHYCAMRFLLLLSLVMAVLASVRGPAEAETGVASPSSALNPKYVAQADLPPFEELLNPSERDRFRVHIARQECNQARDLLLSGYRRLRPQDAQRLDDADELGNWDVHVARRSVPEYGICTALRDVAEGRARIAAAGLTPPPYVYRGSMDVDSPLPVFIRNLGFWQLGQLAWASYVPAAQELLRIAAEHPDMLKLGPRHEFFWRLRLEVLGAGAPENRARIETLRAGLESPLAHRLEEAARTGYLALEDDAVVK